MSEYEEVIVYEDGQVVDAYVERVVDTGPYHEEPPDDYYDEREPYEALCAKCGQAKADHLQWARQHVFTDPEYSDEPPF